MPKRAILSCIALNHPFKIYIFSRLNGSNGPTIVNFFVGNIEALSPTRLYADTYQSAYLIALLELTRKYIIGFDTIGSSHMAYKPISSMLGFFAANAVPHKHAHRTANVQNNAAIFFLIILPPVSAQVSCSFIVIKLYHLKNRLSIPETCYSCKFQDVSRRDRQNSQKKRTGLFWLQTKNRILFYQVSCSSPRLAALR